MPKNTDELLGKIRFELSQGDNQTYYVSTSQAYTKKEARLIMKKIRGIFQ